MKTNAIIRIVVWSLVIVLLLGALTTGLLGRTLRSHYREEVSITHATLETIEGGSIGSPNDTIEEGSADAGKIRELTIEWVAGDITILAKDNIRQIRFAEDQGNCDYPMVYAQKGEKLTIQFCEESFGFRNFSSNISKDLIIEVPADWVCQELELDVAAADLTVRNLLAKEVDFNGAAGNCDFEDCVIGSLDIDAASGDITYSGELNELDFDAASAAFHSVLSNTPRSIDVDGMSGSVDLTLPSDCGYSVSIDGLSSSFLTQSHSTEYRNGMQVYGDGRCIIQVDGMSCDLTIHLSQALQGGSIPSTTAAPQAWDAGGHTHTSSCETDPESCPDHSSTHHKDHE